MSDSLPAARAAVDAADAVVRRAAAHLASLAADGERISVARLDEHQVLAYDLAHAAAAVEGSRVMLDYATHGEVEELLAHVFIADAIADLGTRLLGRTGTWSVSIDALDGVWDYVATYRDPALL